MTPWDDFLILCLASSNNSLWLSRNKHAVAKKMKSSLDISRVAASLKGMLVGDALAAPAHWFYSPAKLRADCGEITGMVAPKPTHAESLVQGMSYTGSIDIMHDKAKYYEGSTLATEARKLSEEEIQIHRDDHGKYAGMTSDKRVHYHASLKKGQNTANSCIARLAMRYLAEANAGGKDGYDPDAFLERFFEYMVTPPRANDDDQIANHNDTYLDIFCRGFFTNASKGTPLRFCALTQRESWSVGSLDGVVLTLPVIAAYAKETPQWVVGRAVEHHMLTHKSITVTATVAALVPVLMHLYRGADLRETLDRAMREMRPPKITGRELGDSYLTYRGPGNIPPKEKWLQHMQLDDSDTTFDLVHRLLDREDEDVAGMLDREHSRLSTACYCEHSFTVVLYLAYKYADDPTKALLQNVMIGGHSTARGAVLGAILGAYHKGIPFVEDLCAKAAIDAEVEALVATLSTGY